MRLTYIRLLWIIALALAVLCAEKAVGQRKVKIKNLPFVPIGMRVKVSGVVCGMQDRGDKWLLRICENKLRQTNCFDSLQLKSLGRVTVGDSVTVKGERIK